jgi:hypothetical protein
MLPSNYTESRDRFIALADEIGAERKSFPHDEDAALSTDVAYLGAPDATKLVLIASGTHGVEGYAGSACQFHLMRHYRQRYAAEGTAFLLVHAVNPWGYFQDRRVTQEGVDLNRNFGGFPVPLQAPSGYGRFHERLVSRYRPMPQGIWNEIRLLGGALSASKRKAIQAAITAGQYDHPGGLFFGGFAPTRSRIVWEGIVDAYARDRDTAFLLDIHTGLGEYGEAELISYLPASSEDFRRLSEWFGGKLKSMASGESVSAAVDGTLIAAFDRAVTGKSHAVGLELGTRPPLAVLYAMRADQWYWNNAQRLSSRRREWARRKMKDAFAPSDAGWHDKLVARFDQVLSLLSRALQ